MPVAKRSFSSTTFRATIERTRIGSAGAVGILLVIACGAPPRRVAVAGESGTPIVVFDARLTRAETLATARASVRTMAFTGDGSGLLLGTRDGTAGRLVALRTGGGARVFDLPLPAVPASMAPAGDGRSVVIAGTVEGDTTGVVVVLSIVGAPAAAAIAACPGAPAGIVLGPDGAKLYATCRNDHVAEIDRLLRRRVRAVPLRADDAPSATPSCDPGSPAMGPGGSRLFVPCRKSGELVKLDRVSLRTVETIPLDGAGILEVATGPSGSLVALAGGASHALILLDGAGRPTGRRIELPVGASRVAATADAKSMYVSGEGREGGWLARVDLERGVTRIVPIPSAHAAIAAWPDRTPPAMWFAK